MEVNYHRDGKRYQGDTYCEVRYRSPMKRQQRRLLRRALNRLAACGDSINGFNFKRVH